MNMPTDIKALLVAAAMAVAPVDTVLMPQAAGRITVVVGESMDDEDDAGDKQPDAGPLYDPSPEEVEAARAYLEARRERLRAEGRDPDEDEE